MFNILNLIQAVTINICQSTKTDKYFDIETLFNKVITKID